MEKKILIDGIKHIAIVCENKNFIECKIYKIQYEFKVFKWTLRIRKLVYHKEKLKRLMEDYVDFIKSTIIDYEVDYDFIKEKINRLNKWDGIINTR